ncbi:MAG TPA: CPBP family glutamic-type intramembrane protease [Solirubrobacteraceae bacterium]|nr:CPBP family glutamic-type intramembrane protease [Solirubrobacteraceae bacterium]
MDRPEPIEGPGPSEEGALGYPYISPEAEPPREEPMEGDRRRSPDTSWRPWMAPVALFAGLALAAVAGLVVDIPLVVFGVKITSSHTPPGVSILDTVVQDVAFVVVAVYCARVGGRAVRSWQFGLRAPGVSWASAGGLIVLLLIVFIVLSAIWSEAVNPGKEKLLEQLGSNEGTLLLVLSAGLTCVVAPICEELLFRGYIFTALRNWHGTLPAALITGVIFGGVHVGSAPALDLVPLAGLGFGLCLLYRYTGSLYTSIAAHSLNNSLAFSSLEDWGWQIPVLIVGSLLAIAALAWAFKRIGLIESSAALPRSGT